MEEKTFVTTIAANFYNKTMHSVFRANSGEQDERIEANIKSVFGFSGGFGLVEGMSQQELDLTRLIFTTRGAVHQLLSGIIDGQEVHLDGKMLFNARLTNCTVHVRTGQFSTYGQCTFEGCQFVFHDAAENIRQLVLA
jgi:hypothetical protein